jgi:preprotein translocase subunit SecF
MFVAKHRNIFFILSGVITAAAVVAMFVYGFNVGIDFKGGSILEVSYESTRPSLETVSDEITKLDWGGFSIRPSGDSNYVVRTKGISPEEKGSLVKALSLNGAEKLKEEKFNSIGPAVGDELTRKAIIAVIVVIIGIVLFVTFAFRKVSKPVSSWKYGLVTILALVHDVIVPTGVYIFYTQFFPGEIDLLFVTAILAILGYSVHDTIVVFDRVRENLHINAQTNNKEHFETTVGKSVSQTFARSINTSVTIFLVLIALYFMGGEATRNFSFVLLVGVIIGTYSSIFLASPLLITLEKLTRRVKRD